MSHFISFPHGEIAADLCNKDYLGGKGFGLVAMSGMNIPVPPGFVIPCHYSHEYHKKGVGKEFLIETVQEAVNLWEAMAHKGLRPLVSVRSGAPVSMPGMMDTILNVGICRDNIDQWSKIVGERTAWDSYRRLIQMLGGTAFGIKHEHFEFDLAKIKKDAGVKSDADLAPEHLRKLADRYEHLFFQHTGKVFPDMSPDRQLYYAIRAVFDSWMNERAIVYRKLNGLSSAMGTAVIVQKMAFGNMNDKSGTGVLFTRNPSTGEKGMFGEFLINAQGEDVVAGIRTPDPIAKMDKMTGEYAEHWSVIYAELEELCANLEAFYHDMVDIEFTVEDGNLFCLQSRVGKRAAIAAFRIATDLLADKVVKDKKAALKTIKASQYVLATRPYVDPSFKAEAMVSGLPASPGVAAGEAVFSAEKAVTLAKQGKKVVLITHETTPDDIAGMNAAEGILTGTGGATSHAAVVARAMDKPCVVGATGLVVTEHQAVYKGSISIAEGDHVVLDGGSGRVWVHHEVPVVDGSKSEYVKTVVQWCREVTGTIPVATSPTEHDCAIYIVDCQNQHTPAELIELLVAAKGHVRLDIRQTSQFAPDEDARDHDTALMFIFGAATPEQTYVMRVIDLLETYADQLKNKVTLTGVNPDEEAHANLLAVGYKTVRGMSKVNDLFGEEPVLVTETDIANLFGDVRTFTKAVAAFEAAQMKVRIAARDAHDETAVFTALGA